MGEDQCRQSKGKEIVATIPGCFELQPTGARVRSDFFQPLMNRLLLAVLLAAALSSAVVFGTDKPTAQAVVPTGFTALINGRDLTGWQEAVKSSSLKNSNHSRP